VPDGTSRHAPVVRAVVLAAGAASRFGGGKLLASLDSRPLIGHVLEALAAAGLDEPIVVLAPAADALRDLVAAHGARWVVNPRPADGLSSSLQLGWSAAMGEDPQPDAVLVVLADQPRLGSALVRRLARAPLDPAHPIVAPHYAGGGGHNPVRVERAAEAHVLAATGDRGLGPLIAARPDLVRWIDAPGTNPDVDRPEDLAAL
jgi:CTP:molybdopterin cytidylyltransferase MocA